MLFPADIFLSLRYLRPKRTFISVITILSITGPALGVAVLIVVMSVMSGFDRDIKARILETQAHLQVMPPASLDHSTAVIDDPSLVIAAMSGLGIKGAPVIETPVLVQNRKRILVKYVRGINPELEQKVTNIRAHVTGKYDIQEGEAIIGRELAYELGVKIGDIILVHAPGKLTENIQWNDDGSVQMKDDKAVFLPAETRVAGIFSMGLYEYDNSLILMNIDQAAELTGLDWGVATSVHAAVTDPFSMNDEAVRLQQALPRLRILTWQEVNGQFFAALRTEKNLMMLVLSFIVLVAAFCISATLLTVVIQKTRDIGVLRAVGFSRFMVARVFVLQGAMIGLFGTVAGTGAGLLTVHFRNAIADLLGTVLGVEVFPKELYHLTQIPAMIKPGDIVIIVTLAFCTCIGASVLPALYASCMSPARALQDDN